MLARATCKERAYVMLICEQGSELSIIESLKEVEGIQEIKRTYGSYDILVKVEAESVDILREVIMLKIRKIARIQTTTTLVCSTESR